MDPRWIGDPVNLGPMCIAKAKNEGYTSFSFHRNLAVAEQYAATVREVAGRKAIVFVEPGKYPLYVVGETPRPRPVITVMT